jgi:hypothetical protein
MQGMQRVLIVDSGSSVSILQPGVVCKNIQSTIRAPYGVTGDILPVTGEQQVSFRMGNVSLSHTFLVCTLPTNISGILGMDFLEPIHAVLNMTYYILNKSLTFSRKYVSTSVRQEYGSCDGELKS